MPKFKITDPQSGKTVTVSGETAPTQLEAEEIFGQAGLRKQEIQMDFQETPEPSFFEKITPTREGLGALPVVFGVTAGAAGMAVGSLPGGAIGTVIGFAAGTALAETLEDLFRIQDELPEEQVKKAVTTSLIAGALDFATAGVFKFVGGRIVTPIAKKVLGQIGKIGEKLSLKSIRPTTSQARKFFERTGIELKDFAVEKGLFKKGVEQVDEMIGPIQRSFDEIAISSNRPVLLGQMTSKFNDLIAGYKNTTIKKNLQIASKLEEIKNLVTKKFRKVSLTVEDITRERRAVDQVLRDTSFDKKGGAQDIATVLQREVFQETVQDSTKGLVGVGGKNLDELGTELSKLFQFKKIAAAQDNLGIGKLPFGFSVRTGLTVGGATVGGIGEGDIGGAVKGALIGWGLPVLANNPKVISFVVRNLIRIGDVANALPAAQRSKFVLEAFRRVFTNLGALNLSTLGQDSKLPEIQQPQ